MAVTPIYTSFLLLSLTDFCLLPSQARARRPSLSLALLSITATIPVWVAEKILNKISRNKYGQHVCC